MPIKEENIPGYMAIAHICGHDFIQCQRMWRGLYVEMLHERDKWRIRAIMGWILAIAATIEIFV